MERIISTINNSINVKKQILGNKDLIATVLKVAEEIVQAFKNDKKVLF